jgi:hypothetical protein
MNTSNFLTATDPVAIWSVVELSLGLVAASMVTLKPLLQKLYTRERSYGSSQKNGYMSNHHTRDFHQHGREKSQGGRVTMSESEVELNDLEAQVMDAR